MFGKKDRSKADALGSERKTEFDTPLGKLRIQANGKVVPFRIEKLPAALKEMGRPGMLFKADERYRVVPDVGGVADGKKLFDLSLKCGIALDLGADIGDGFEFGPSNATLVLFEGSTALALGCWNFEDEPEGLFFQTDTLYIRSKNEHELPYGMELAVSHRDCLRYAEFYIAWLTLGRGYEGTGCALDDPAVRDLWDAVNTDLYDYGGGYWITGKGSAGDAT